MRRGDLTMYEPHHSVMSNEWVLISFLGFIIALSIWKLSPAWGFLLILFSIIVFLSSYISAVRAPLMSDEEIELAVHEKYHQGKYPDTDLHHGLVPKQKKYVHSRHKKKLVELYLAESAKGKSKRRPAGKKSVKKAARKKAVPKKASVRGVARKKSVRKAAAKKAARSTRKKATRRKASGRAKR